MDSTYKSKNIDHLGLLAGLMDEIGLVSTIDKLIPSDPTHKLLSHGTIVKALVLNGLGYINRRLYLVSDFFSDKPVDLLLGEGVEASHLNDDALGRSLDAIYEYGCSSLYEHLSLSLLTHFDWFSKFGYLDSSQFHVHGAYNSAVESNEHLIEIVRGYSKDHRPDLNQVGLALIMNSRYHLPLLMRSLSGNASDSEEFASMVEEHINCLHSNYGLEYMVADSKFYYAEHLQSLSKAGILWISRVPSTISDVGEVLSTMDLSFTRQASEENPYTYKELRHTYGEVEQRWLVVYSLQAHQRAQKNVSKQFSKAFEKESKEVTKLCKKSFACQKDAQNALQALKKKLKYSLITKEEIQEKGKGKTKTKKISEFQIQVTSQEDSKKKEDSIYRKAFFIIASNQLDTQALPAKIMLSEYKGLSGIEKGFKFLKDPQVLASSFFVNKPQRVEALLFVMTLCLLIYAALEQRIREKLQQSEQTLPNQLGKPTNKPTARWIFACFVGIHLLHIDQRKKIILNLRELHHKVLKLLGEPYLKYYQNPVQRE